MKKILCLIPLFFGLFHINSYASDKKKYYDKANVKNRNYGSNFKDYALTVCLQIIDEKLKRTNNEDLKGASGALWDAWVRYDLNNIKKTEYILDEIDRLSKKYINNAGGLKDQPKATVYTFGCLNFYHSDDLDKLMKQFVLHPNMTFRQNYPNQ